MGKNSAIKLFMFLVLLSLSFIPRIAQADYLDPVATLEEHYYAISHGDLETAYHLRSNKWRLNHSFEWFYKNWGNNSYIELLSSKLVSNDGYDAVVKIRLYSEDYNPSGKLISAYYRGKAYLVYEKGTWKIDDIQVSEE